jgi:hypothetical protein
LPKITLLHVISEAREGVHGGQAGGRLLVTEAFGASGEPLIEQFDRFSALGDLRYSLFPVGHN